jgi:hypothetical protein
VEKGAWNVEPDQVNVLIGSSSADIKLKKIVGISVALLDPR